MMLHCLSTWLTIVPRHMDAMVVVPGGGGPLQQLSEHRAGKGARRVRARWRKHWSVMGQVASLLL
jgi:hypothetical protein